jgi:hypothetical protein
MVDFSPYCDDGIDFDGGIASRIDDLFHDPLDGGDIDVDFSTRSERLLRPMNISVDDERRDLAINSAAFRLFYHGSRTSIQ